jgi:hypothetical protein
MNTSPQEALEELGRRLEAQGFRFRAAPYFAASGIVVFTRAVPTASDKDILLIEAGVFLYPVGDVWEARVTRHGGPHWTRQADTLVGLEELAREALRSRHVPPNLGWRIETT